MLAATCPPSYSWADNSSGSDPCHVALSLMSVCNPSANLLPISNGQSYPAPTTGQGDDCTCSSVVYSLVSACSDCQGGSFDSWKQWSSNCSTTSEGFLPINIPTGAEPPEWATDPSMFNPGFDPSVAFHRFPRGHKGKQKQPTYTSSPQAPSTQGPPQQSTPGSSSGAPNTSFTTTVIPSSSSQPSKPTQTSSQIPSSMTSLPDGASISSILPSPDSGTLISTSAPFSSTTIPTETAPAESSNPFSPDVTPSGSTQNMVSMTGAVSKSNVGAIAGGVIGGFFALLIGGLVLRWFLIRYRRAHTAPSAEFMVEYGRERPMSLGRQQNDSTAYLNWQRFGSENNLYRP